MKAHYDATKYALDNLVAGPCLGLVHASDLLFATTQCLFCLLLLCLKGTGRGREGDCASFTVKSSMLLSISYS
jgi:hypothetical protein